MPRRLIELGAGRPLLDIASYARRGPADRVHLAQEEIQLLSRTVRRTPEVMVKVLTKGGHDRKTVGRHLRYLSREGEVEIETDDGQRLRGRASSRSCSRIGTWISRRRVERRPLDRAPGSGSRSSSTRWFSRCQRVHRGTGYFGAHRHSGRRLVHSIAMRWCCTRTNRIRTFIWLLRR
jgi:hypothetical protein